MVASALQQPRFFAPGDKLGKYELVRQIAIGGMAELYLARTMGIEGFEKLVVVKRILPQFATSQSVVAMFLDEARLAATLHHPNIARVFDLGHDQSDYFFSMEYVHGEDLGRLVASATDSGVPISLDAALTFATGLCAGLHYAHEKLGADRQPLNVVHRDVSPSNVLVSYDGAVKLVDFGLARAGSAPSTSKRGLEGKIAYMSPEQCQGLTTLDRRSDLFSVGAILYELTTGRLPFVGETESGVLNQIVTRDAEPPSTWVPGYPPALEAIVMRALARDPERRYRTALELQGQLEDFAHASRLRISPLVLARLMSGLFPARLEEWAHAKAQGAFFVEQHIVQTLIESGKTSDSGPAARPREGDEDPTNVVRPIRATTPPAAAPPRASQPPHRPSAPWPAAPHPRFVAPMTAVVTPLDYVGDHTEHVRPLDARGVPTVSSARRRRSQMRRAAVVGGGLVALAVIFGIATSGRSTPGVVDVPPPTASRHEPLVPTDLAAEPTVAPAPAPTVAPEPAPAVTVPVEPVTEPVAAPVAKRIAKPGAGKRPTSKRPRHPSGKLPPKPDPKPDQEKPWDADSPFMPVRPAARN